MKKILLICILLLPFLSEAQETKNNKFKSVASKIVSNDNNGDFLESTDWTPSDIIIVISLTSKMVDI
jgi:hypothetical protein